MLDKNTEDFLTKLAARDTTGMTQYKKRTVKHYKKYPGEGAGVGGGLGLAAGHLIGKSLSRGGNVARLAGLLIGAGGGYELGRRGSSTKTKTIEGTVRKQEKSKEPMDVLKLTGKNLNF